MQGHRKLTMICCAAVLTLGLAACGGGGSDDDTAMVCPAGQIGTYPDCMDPPTPYETASEAIAAATTAEAAQAAYDAVKDDVTAAQGEMLQDAVDARIMAIQMAARVDEQKMALSDAAGMIDTDDLSTQELVDAANEAIRGLRQALEDADDVSDADKAMYMSQLNDAVAAVDEAQGGIDTATRRTNQMAALTSASTTLQTALAALSGSTPTQAQLDAANNALTALNAAITAGADLTDDEKAPYQREATNAAAPIQMAETAKDAADDEAEKTANAAMAITATRLHKGLEHGLGDTDNVRTGVSDPNGVISVTIGTDAAVPLAEDKKTTVAANHGWEGKRHAAEPTGDVGTYESYVYSNVGEPTEGAKFSAQYPSSEGFVSDAGVVTIDTSGTDTPASRVASPSFDQSAGTKTFKLPTPNLDGVSRINILGSFHGVSGTYTCVPTGGHCAATVAATGFTLGFVDEGTTTGAGTWTFKPSNPDAKVMSVDDMVYASYGWWLHKSEDGATYTASAFATARGNVDAASGITALRGTATYMGGAAGKYALSSSTGGENDAGHFTARATLEADFNADMISGTIDNFMGADGESRDWSVELKKSGVGDTGIITGSDGTGDPMETVWTIGGTAAGADGRWSGTLYDNGDDNVPQVATGTFHSIYGRDGRMVGAFGANKQ